MSKSTKILLTTLLLLPLIMLLTGAFMKDYQGHQQFAKTLMNVGETFMWIEGTIVFFYFLAW